MSDDRHGLNPPDADPGEGARWVRCHKPGSQTASGRDEWRWEPIDLGVADIVERLQEDDRPFTAGACDGHGRGPGEIILADGRRLVVHPAIDPEVERGLRALESVHPRKLSALNVARLRALVRGRPRTVGEAHELLWPELSQENANAGLRRLLSRLSTSGCRLRIRIVGGKLEGPARGMEYWVAPSATEMGVPRFEQGD